MLRFASRPDRVFLAILHASIEFARTEIDPLNPGYAPSESEFEDLNENYGRAYPVLADFFTRDEMLRLLDRLPAVSQDPDTLFQITDWCWLILYTCVEDFINVHNDGELGTNEVGPYRIGRIDFDAILHEFFWDLDFLAGRTIMDLGERGRERMGVNPETFGIAAGLKPHPDEVAIVPVAWETPDGKPFKPKGPAAGKIPRYPGSVRRD